MKVRPIALVCALLAVSCCLKAQAPASSFVTGTKEDEAAIRAIIQSADADKTDPHTAADLDWENAFGIRYTDLKKRDAFYGAVVKPQMKNLTDNSTLEVKVKFIEPTVAVADEYWHIAGQVYGGETKPGPDRWGRTTYFFKKEQGVWIEVLERVADLRVAYYKHYDSLPAPVPVPADVLGSYAGSYQKAPGGTIVEVVVHGNTLAITRRGETFTAIPTSATEFLVFDPNDLAEYNKVTFAKTPDGEVTYTFAWATGELIATLTKIK